MRVDMRVVLPLLVLCASLALDGKDKKSILPTYVLNAQTVLVLIDPEAGTPMNAPLANKTAQDDVDKALMKWGRLKPVLDGYTADLVITVRKGSDKVVQPTVGGLPTNDRPVIVQPTDSGIQLGPATGNPGFHPDRTRPASGSSAARRRFCGVRGARGRATRALARVALREKRCAAFAERSGRGGIPQGHRRGGKAATATTTAAAETEGQAISPRLRPAAG